MNSVKLTKILSVIIFIIVGADMLSSFYWLQTGLMTEGNPIMAFMYDVHPSLFLISKTITFAPLVYLVFKYTDKITNPLWINIILILGIIVYIAAYFIFGNF